MDNARNKYNAYNGKSKQSECLLSLLELLLSKLLWLVCGILRGRGSRSNNSSGLTLLRRWLNDDLVNGRLEDLYGVRQRLLGADLAFRIPALHAKESVRKAIFEKYTLCLHLDLDTKDTLPEHDVSDSIVNEILSGLTRVDHEAVGELHGLGTSGTELARNNDFATLSTRLHDETQDTIASPSSWLL